MSALVVNAPRGWDELDRTKYQDERSAIASLLSSPPFSVEERATVVKEAALLVEDVRRVRVGQGAVESVLTEFPLASAEGLALMQITEALLRTPDNATRDRLIAEKVSAVEWGASRRARGAAPSLTARILALSRHVLRSGGEGRFGRLVRGVAAALVRMGSLIRIAGMGEQFVFARTIDEGLVRAAQLKHLCSFDMLGEGARTDHDAARYERIYAEAIEAVGKAKGGTGPENGHGVSIKLSALSPRYEATQEARVWAELYPRVKRLALIAAKYDLNCTIDAEEADRLALSLKLLDRLARDPELGEWTGLGLAVQAYQKRGPEVIRRVADLAKRTRRRLMVRLVKGAYWDTEIKRAQVAGRPDYPVYTTKPATDLSYLVSARELIAASPHLYAQFATHNAHTLCAVRKMAADAGVKIEFQRLHGMGEALYAAADRRYGEATLRAYAPVGGHEDLLPYLVRRLLENGANSSFVHALLDERVPAADVVRDPIAAVEAQPGPHPRIPTPRHMYANQRENPLGRDYSQAEERARIARAFTALDDERLTSGPIVGGKLKAGEGARPVLNPFDHSRQVGEVSAATQADVDEAVRLGAEAQVAWDRAGGVARAKVLRAMGDALEANTDRLITILSREAGKTLNDGVAEVREAVDFCRYYAGLAEKQFALPEPMDGPVGETNHLVLHGRGVFVAISPWNFPLAIFTGQIVGALAAGNAVMAKPAAQTPLIAAEAVRIFHKAGLDPNLLALLPGPGRSVGQMLVTHPGIDGVVFTGGTDTAWGINRQLAAREGPIVPFIAETGGLNGMFVDTTALREQVIDDVILSAFGSAGQRCSALRVLYVPKDSADQIIEGLKGAMDALVLNDPSDPATDVGPVIDAGSRKDLDAHVERLRKEAKILKELDPGKFRDQGSFFGPVMAEIPTPDFLEKEVFGPILHIYRYDPADLAATARKLAARGYGLTLGVHSRIEAFAQDVMRLVPAGNVYVNRSIIGAVVGVQPFGGEGLSGTGPKAGGPNSLVRFASERTISVNIAAQGGDPALLNL